MSKPLTKSKQSALRALLLATGDEFAEAVTMEDRMRQNKLTKKDGWYDPDGTRFLNAVTEKEAQAYYVWIYIAGDIDVIKHACREFCQVGLCVTVETLDFIYTGGEESGVRVGLINYPRFQSTPDEIWEKARDLALFIRDKAFQDSVLIMDKDKTLWISKRQN